MATLGYVNCDVSAGVFSSERFASIQGVDRKFEAIVDSDDVVTPSSINNNSSTPAKLRVFVISRHGDTSFIELPRDTIQGTRRIRVESRIVAPA